MGGACSTQPVVGGHPKTNDKNDDSAQAINNSIGNTNTNNKTG